jgi:hypothetical protein
MFKPSPKMSCSSANDIPEVDPDAEFDPLLRRGVHVALGHPPLHLDSAPDGVHHAGELGEEPVPGVLYDPAPVFPDLRIDQLPAVRAEPFVRPLLIRPHKARVPGYVGGEDRGEAADRGHVSRGSLLA